MQDGQGHDVNVGLAAAFAAFSAAALCSGLLVGVETPLGVGLVVGGEAVLLVALVVCVRLSVTASRERKRLIADLETRNEELAESERRFRATFEQAAVGIAHTDPNARILRANHRFAQMLGYQPDELVGEHVETVTVADGFPEETRLADELLAGNLPSFTLEKRYVHRDGHIVWADLTLSLVRGEDGEVLYSVGMVQDVSERKHAERDRRELELQLRHAQKMQAVGELAGGIAHEFNNLLGGVLANAELIAENTDERTRERTSRIISSARRAAALTQQLLSFSRRGQIRAETVSIAEVMEAAEGILAATVGTGVEVVFHNTAHDACVEGDSELLESALLSLAVNARDAMPDGGTLTIRTDFVDLKAADCQSCTEGSLQPGRCVRLQVIDTGIGMTEEVRERVFEPFFTTKPRDMAAGLGLSGVYGTVHSHGGHIDVRSEPGRGSVFEILLPLSPETSVRGGDETDEAEGAMGTVLVVDDEEIIRDVTVDALECLEIAAHTAIDGQQAVDWFRKHSSQVGLVLLDLIMPVMGGAETLRALRDIDPDVPVIVCSGFGEERALEEVRAAGATAFLHKPFSVIELRDAVKQHRRGV